MENISFALILFLLGSLLPLSVHGAPGGTVPTDENKSIEETTTEVAVSINETVTENNSSSTNGEFSIHVSTGSYMNNDTPIPL